MDISHKFLRTLPPRYDTIVTLLVRTDLKKTSPSEILGEILSHDMFKEDQEEAQNEAKSDKKKIIFFKAKASKVSDDESEGSTDEEVALMVKRFKKFMKKKKGFGSGQYKSGVSSSKNPFTKKKCYECAEVGHISKNCKNKDAEESSPKKKNFESKKKFFKNFAKKKGGKAYCVEWDSDASSDSDDDSDDEENDKSTKKGLADIAIKEAQSPFDSPLCLMAKGESKVCDDDDVFSYDDLVEMVSNLDDLLGNMKSKYKDLKKEYTSLEKS